MSLINASIAIVSICFGQPAASEPEPRLTVRVMTANVEDVRPEAVGDPMNERLQRFAGIVREIAPDVLFLNEFSFVDGVSTAEKFEASFVALDAQGQPTGRSFAVYAAPSNTGVPSGFDLDNNGTVGTPDKPREYGGDCLGYGEFPGQYAMAILVRKDWTINREKVRTFRTFKWKDMPGALLPPAEDGREGGWYTPEELAVLPLSSKSHWDVPVTLPDGRTLHILCSHPTPPVFDGAEDRNGRRNHDEIRFWADYIANAEYIVDDNGVKGGLAEGEMFVIVGDLNADPHAGDTFENPMRKFLLRNPKVRGEIAPSSRVAVRGLDDTDTSRFKLRVDYVLPSAGIDVVAGAVWRGPADSPGAKPEPNATPIPDAPSDHFPVWVDLRLPLSTPAPGDSR